MSSRTARRSSIHSSSVGSAVAVTGSDKPTPRLSKRITRANAASRSLNRASGLTSRSISTLLNHCSATTTSTSPDPNIRYAMCTSPLFAYRVGLAIRSVSDISRTWAGRRRPWTGYAPLMGNQLVKVKDFPGLTIGDAIKIASYRLTQQGYHEIEPLPGQPQRAEDGLWRLPFRVAD